MPVCHGYHGLFEACGGMTGALGSTPLHRLGGIKQEIKLRELSHDRKLLEALNGKAAVKDMLVAAKANAFRGAAQLTSHETAILRQEHAHRLQLLAGKSLSQKDRNTVRQEAHILKTHITRADHMEAIRQDKLARMTKSANDAARLAREHPSPSAKYFADKAAAELEAYTHREAVTYTHFEGNAEQRLREAFGGNLPRRSQIAAALGLTPGHDLTFYTRGDRLFAKARGPGYSLTAKRGPGQPPVSHAYLVIGRDAAGRVQAKAVSRKMARRMQLAELRERLDALHSREIAASPDGW